MSSKIWVYNYDFEFELAELPPVVFGFNHTVPWYFLNRSSSWLIPLANSTDTIITYAAPPPQIIKNLTAKCGKLPYLLPISAGTDEDNSVVAFLKKKPDLLHGFADHELSVWGWSRSAKELATNHFENSISEEFCDAVITANSKKSSDSVRNQRIHEEFCIPSLQIVDPDISLDSLNREITGFMNQHGQSRIKHFFGASGKLSYSLNPSQLNRKKLSLFKSWISNGKGILLEKSMPIASEYSIQAEIGDLGTVHPIAFTEHFTNSNGSYLGNLIDQQLLNQHDDVISRLLPVFKFLADTGYRGPVGLDLLMTPERQIKLVEINARITMGRIAFAWNGVLNEFPLGFFSNFFLKTPAINSLDLFMEHCSNLEKRFKCAITMIQFIRSPKKSLSLVTIFIGANTKNDLMEVFRHIISVSNQSIKT